MVDFLRRHIFPLVRRDLSRLLLTGATGLTMIPTQPLNPFSYLSRSTSRSLAEGIRHRFYLSWEDAMWDLVDRLPIRAGTKVLVPDFWCEDVIKNMTAHGMICHRYPMDRAFQTPEEIMGERIHTIDPSIVIVFHAVGIRNRLLSEHRSWLQHLHPDQILIEDSVHSIVDPSGVRLLHPRHIIIDSWRKVVPLQGSVMYHSADLDRHLTPLEIPTPPQTLAVCLLWALMQIFLTLQYALRGRLGHMMGLCAERLMLIGYNRIGKNEHSAPIPGVFIRLWSHIDIERIWGVKRAQVSIYMQRLGDVLSRDERVFSIWRRPTDDAHLRGFPVGLVRGTAHELLGRLRDAGLLVRHELDDSPWSMRQKVIFLPLGPYLDDSDIHSVCDILLANLATQ